MSFCAINQYLKKKCNNLSIAAMQAKEDGRGGQTERDEGIEKEVRKKGTVDKSLCPNSRESSKLSSSGLCSQRYRFINSTIE